MSGGSYEGGGAPAGGPAGEPVAAAVQAGSVGAYDGPGFGRRVAMVFVAPRRLFETFQTRAPVVDVLAVSTLITALSILAMPDEAFLIDPEDAVSRRGTPVEITSSPRDVARFGRYLGMMGTLVAHPLLALAVAGALTLAFTVLGGGPAGFRPHLAVTSHAFLIGALGLVVAAGLAWIDPAGARWLSSAALVPPDSNPSLPLAIAASLDLFTIWMLGVLSLGASVLDPRRSWPSAAAAVLGVYVVLIAIRHTVVAV